MLDFTQPVTKYHVATTTSRNFLYLCLSRKHWIDRRESLLCAGSISTYYPYTLDIIVVVLRGTIANRTKYYYFFIPGTRYVLIVKTVKNIYLVGFYVPGGFVGGPRAYQDQFRGFKSHRVHARRGFFLYKRNWLAESARAWGWVLCNSFWVIDRGRKSDFPKAKKPHKIGEPCAVLSWFWFYFMGELKEQNMTDILNSTWTTTRTRVAHAGLGDQPSTPRTDQLTVAQASSFRG